MASRESLAGWLRAGGVPRIAAVLQHRPDAAAPPPGTVDELAERIAARPSVLHAADDLDLTCLQVVDTMQLLGPDVGTDALVELHGAGPELDRALGRLTELALVWTDGEGRLTLAGQLRSIPATLPGLGEPLRSLLGAQRNAQLVDLAHRTGCPVPTTESELPELLFRHLTDPERVRAVAADAPPAVAELLEALVRGHPRLAEIHRRHPQETVFGPPEVRWLMERGLVFASSWSTVDLPREMALVLRGPGPPLPLDPQPPAPTGAAVPPSEVDVAAGAAALGTLDGVDRLIDACESAPVALLRTGGVGTRELRRLGRTLAAAEPEVRLWLELAADAGLLAATATEVLPATGVDDWRASEPAVRLVTLLEAWWVAPDVPSCPLRDIDGARPATLGRRSHGVGPALRRALLAELHRDVAVLPERLWPVVAWRLPMLLGSDEVREEAGPATLEEARALGVAALGARSGLAAALQDPDRTELAERARAMLPPLVDSVRLLPDLTAVVAGVPAPSLTALLDRVAERESRDTASTWRFTPASARRALDSGDSVEGLLAALTGVSDGELPQPLEYLIHDAGRRHGHIQVAAVACCVTSQDVPLLAEAVRDRRLRRAGLRCLAPTVLASAVPVADTVELLREAGYAPVELDDTGVLRLRRPEPRRAPAAPRVRRTPQTPSVPDAEQAATLAAALLSSGARSSLTAQHVRRHSGDLPPAQVRALADAVDRGLPVVIDYVDSGGRASRRVVEPLEFAPPMLIAWCRLRDDERNFLLDRIVSVSPA